MASEKSDTNPGLSGLSPSPKKIDSCDLPDSNRDTIDQAILKTLNHYVKLGQQPPLDSLLIFRSSGSPIGVIQSGGIAADIMGRQIVQGGSATRFVFLSQFIIVSQLLIFDQKIFGQATSAMLVNLKDLLPTNVPHSNKPISTT